MVCIYKEMKQWTHQVMLGKFLFLYVWLPRIAGVFPTHSYQMAIILKSHFVELLHVIGQLTHHFKAYKTNYLNVHSINSIGQASIYWVIEIWKIEFWILKLNFFATILH